MATLKSVMSDDVDDVFLDTDEHGHALTLYKGGDPNCTPVSLTGNVDEAHLEGSREVQGDGIYPYRPEGNVQRESIIFSIKSSIAIADHQSRRPDVIKWDGKYWTVMRVTGRDADMMDVLCARTTREWTQTPRSM